MKVKQYISLMAALVMTALLFSCTVTVENNATGSTTPPPIKYSFSLEIANDSDVTGEIVIDKTTPDSSYVKGTTITVEATSDAEKTFFGWYDASSDGNLVSWDSSYSFSLEEDCALYAKFAPNIITFSDETLHKEVEKAIIKAGDTTGVTTLVNLAKIKELSYNGTGQTAVISNLKGLEYLTGLTSLELPGNQIVNLAPIRNLNKVTHLIMNNNLIQDIKPLENLTELKTLQLNINQIDDLSPIQGLTKITLLQLMVNDFTTLTPIINNRGINGTNTTAVVYLTNKAEYSEQISLLRDNKKLTLFIML